MKFFKELTTTTQLTKYLAMALFTLLPFLGFYLGMQYEKNMSRRNPSLAITTSTPSQTPSSETTIKYEFSDGKKLLDDFNLKTGKQSLFLVYGEGASDSSSEKRVHLIDLGLCSDPSVLAYYNNYPKDKFVLKAGGCGDGQGYYVVSLTSPFHVQELTLPYSYVDSYGSEPITWIDENTLVFKKQSYTSENDPKVELYTVDMRAQTSYKKITLPN